MSKQIQDDKCHNVSSMTVEGIRKMLLIQKMTLRQNVKKSLSQATKTEKTVTPLYIYVGYRYRKILRYRRRILFKRDENLLEW